MEKTMAKKHGVDILQMVDSPSWTTEEITDNPPFKLDNIPDDMIPTKEQEEMIKEVFKNNPGVYEDGLAVTPEAKVAFLSELIKKPVVEITPQDIVQTKVDISSSAPRTANNYSRRNLAVLKTKVEDVLKSSTYLDNINIEERGVFKCRPDKPIKNAGGVHK